MNNEPNDFPFDDSDAADDVQRQLNAAKRQDLTDKYGAQFFNPEEETDLPPEVEGQWLDYVAAFEQQFENARQVTVREFVGNPVVRPLAEVPAAELETELDHLQNVLAEAEVYVDFIHEIAPAEAYRFIAEELLNETMDEVRIPGMEHHFIYEEFHPNDQAEAQMWAEEFMNALISEDPERLVAAVADELRVGNRALGKAQLPALITRFHQQHPDFANFKSRLLTCTVTDDDATAEFTVFWESCPPSTPLDAMQTVGRAHFALKRGPYGDWDVTQVTFPSLS